MHVLELYIKIQLYIETLIQTKAIEQYFHVVPYYAVQGSITPSYEVTALP